MTLTHQALGWLDEALGWLDDALGWFAAGGPTDDREASSAARAARYIGTVRLSASALRYKSL
jgi:hypothetical protein